MKKYELILDMNTKLSNSITETNTIMEEKWEEKKNLTEAISKAR